MTMSFGELKRGMTIELEGAPYIVVEYERVKMQQRAPVVRLRLKDLRTGRVTDRSFQGYDVKLTRAPVENRNCQYIYNDGQLYYFMDTETFEQFPLSEDRVGVALKYLKEGSEAALLFYHSEAVTIELPITVDLKIVDTPPGVRGDTASGGSKPATLETGLIVQVPLFINSGEVIKVDTRTGQYLERVG